MLALISVSIFGWWGLADGSLSQLACVQTVNLSPYLCTHASLHNVIQVLGPLDTRLNLYPAKARVAWSWRQVYRIFTQLSAAARAPVQIHEPPRTVWRLRPPVSSLAESGCQSIPSSQWKDARERSTGGTCQIHSILRCWWKSVKNGHLNATLVYRNCENERCYD